MEPLPRPPENDRDLNAARNILRRGIDELASAEAADRKVVSVHV